MSTNFTRLIVAITLICCLTGVHALPVGSAREESSLEKRWDHLTGITIELFNRGDKDTGAASGGSQPNPASAPTTSGGKSGSVAGYTYTDANKQKSITWDENTLFDHLENPKKYIPAKKGKDGK